jgi:hypothetical protein
VTISEDGSSERGKWGRWGDDGVMQEKVCQENRKNEVGQDRVPRTGSKQGIIGEIFKISLIATIIMSQDVFCKLCIRRKAHGGRKILQMKIFT